MRPCRLIASAVAGPFTAAEEGQGKPPAGAGSCLPEADKGSYRGSSPPRDGIPAAAAM